jgi:hypothetical protein
MALCVPFILLKAVHMFSGLASSDKSHLEICPISKGLLYLSLPTK